jgi:hypothetical protein
VIPPEGFLLVSSLHYPTAEYALFPCRGRARTVGSSWGLRHHGALSNFRAALSHAWVALQGVGIGPQDKVLRLDA